MIYKLFILSEIYYIFIFSAPLVSAYVDAGTWLKKFERSLRLKHIFILFLKLFTITEIYYIFIFSAALLSAHVDAGRCRTQEIRAIAATRGQGHAERSRLDQGYSDAV